MASFQGVGKRNFIVKKQNKTTKPLWFSIDAATSKLSGIKQ
jgi:hypothetical protein